MSPPRRRSSRLAAVVSKTSKAAPELSSVSEYHDALETPRKSTRSSRAFQVTPQPEPSTPASSALKPPHDEMHPSKCQTTMAAPSSALRLGFSDIRPSNNSGALVPSGAQGTPTKIGRPPSSAFTFRFVRGDTDMKLSENAQRLMDELREQANKIKADLVSQREAEGGIAFGNPSSAAKAKADGRFSAAHAAEFSKMDSIEGHASAWRANRGTPIKSSLKRSPSKAELDSAPSSAKSNLKRSQVKAEVPSTPQSRLKPSLKRTASRADLDDDQPQSGKKLSVTASASRITRPVSRGEPVSSFAKRIKKHQEEDTSSGRPVSRDDSSIPRPKSSGQGTSDLTQSSLARLMSPTKSSRAHTAEGASKPTITLVKSPSVSTTLTTSATPSTVGSPTRLGEMRRRIISPNRFQKVKSILRNRDSQPGEARTALPKPSLLTSQTPAPPRSDRDLSLAPFTTPRRKLAKQVAFTPETKRAAEVQNSPSPQKTLNFKDRLARTKLNLKSEFSSLDGILADSTASPAADGDVVYPDLSALKALTEAQEEKKPSQSQPAPGTFTFRSDHTINFGAASASGFGASPGQSSVRQVRSSLAPATKFMPGSFPVAPSPSSHPNKENRVPPSPNMIPGAPHGMSNKKRHRATWDEDDAEREAAERAAKKQKNEHVPEGQALLAPRLTAATPKSTAKKTPVSRSVTRSVSRTPGSPSPIKKRGGLSMSRLNMLARPKNRA